jgi:hypothetical protein
MTHLRRSLFWVALYITIIIVLGVLDLENLPIINFASYFYISALIIGLVVTVVPSLSNMPLYLLLVICGVIYLALGRVINRSYTGSTALDVIILELVIIELGVWLSYQLGGVITHSESLIDVLAQGSFPNRATDLDAASDLINIEFGRCRRYHRQISLMILQANPENKEAVREILKSLQQDMLSRLHLARIAQVVSECIRQTDTLLRDHSEHFVILCPETTLESMIPLAKRIKDKVLQRTGLVVNFGLAAFPEEALTFEDLLQVARNRLKASIQTEVTTEKHHLIES